MKRKKIIPLALAIVIITGVTLYFEVFRHLGGRDDRISGSGTIEVTEVEMASKLTGHVQEIPVEEGDRVKKGERLVRLSHDELKAKRLSARAGLDNAEKNLARVRRLHRSGSVSRQAYDNALTEYRVAKANYDYIIETIRQAELVAPIDGLVLEKNLEKGELAFPGTPIVTLADLTRPWIKLYIQEKKLGLVRRGQKAEVTIDSYPDETFPGEVVYISDRAEFTPKTIQTREERVKLVFAVKIMIENRDRKLKPGMPADAVILLEK
jgi:HlyD family secretion protein